MMRGWRWCCAKVAAEDGCFGTIFANARLSYRRRHGRADGKFLVVFILGLPSFSIVLLIRSPSYRASRPCRWLFGLCVKDSLDRGLRRVDNVGICRRPVKFRHNLLSRWWSSTTKLWASCRCGLLLMHGNRRLRG